MALAFFNSATSEASNTVTLPASLTSDMRAFLIDCAENGDTSIPTLVTPTGWTSVGSFTGVVLASFGVRIALSYKDLVGTESSSSITGMDCSTTNGGKVVQVYTGRSVGVFGTPTSFLGSAGAPPLANQTITAGTAAGIAIACSGKFVGIQGLTMSPAASNTQSTATVMTGGDIVYTSASTNNTVSVPATLGGGMLVVWQPFTDIFMGQAVF